MPAKKSGSYHLLNLAFITFGETIIMLLDNIKPSPALADFISCYRIADFVFATNEVIPSKAYPPRPQECLQFFPRDVETVSYNNGISIRSTSGCAITGQHTVVNHRYVGKNFLTVLVVFKPGILYRLTCIPASELANSYVDAADIAGRDIIYINEQLYHAASYNEMIEIVENYLLALISRAGKKQHIIHTIARQMLYHNRSSPVDYFMREACLCPRQFDRKFKEYMGINPKLYTRIIRFDNAFRMKNRLPHKDWLTIALHCGYHDYQHLVRDYKDLTGCTLNEFLILETKAPERFFGDVDT